MLVTTTPSIEGRRIVQYFGLVSGETIIGANLVKDFFASITDIVGGRSGAYEQVLKEAKDSAIAEMVQQAKALGPTPSLPLTWIMKPWAQETACLW
jgi:uncharacterized protein YbjQ (UPF0145 family)